jgi:small subunit ribosomal protein S20
MANHKSALKRIRQSHTKNLRNKYYAKTMRNAIKTIRETENKAEAVEMLPKVVALVDSVAKRNIIHKKKAANLKSGVAKYVNSLA